MQEFVEYHINGDGECNTVVLKEWAHRKGLNAQERYELAYFFSITYSVLSAIVLFSNKALILESPIEASKQLKSSIVFQSDRKYIKMRDSFKKCLEWFRAHSNAEHLACGFKDGFVDIGKAVAYTETWTMFGRFSAFLFWEAYINLIDSQYKNATIEWKDGNTATSGLLNLYGYDNEADVFDQKGILPFTQERMDAMLSGVLDSIVSNGGSANVTEVETSLCAYRKFYKGSRYNGYYLDRMLEEIHIMESSYPEVAHEVLNIRESCFDHKYLGEINGWTGIRKKMKRVYRDTGCVL